MDKKIIIICKTGKKFVDFCNVQGINHRDNNVRHVDKPEKLEGLDLSPDKATIYWISGCSDIPEDDFNKIDEMIQVKRYR